jgi:hypothetical protein
MPIECKIFPNLNAANGALNAVLAAWVPPTQTNLGGGLHVLPANLPPQTLTAPEEMVDGRYAVWADHPGFKGEFVTRGDVKRHVECDTDVVALAAAVAESGIVARKSAVRTKETA